MIKSFNKFKKPCFWSIFPNFGPNNFFRENPALSRTTSCGFLAPCQNSEKSNDTILRKCQDRRTDRPYFMGHFRLLSWVQKLTLREVNFYLLFNSKSIFPNGSKHCSCRLVAEYIKEIPISLWCQLFLFPQSKIRENILHINTIFKKLIYV